METGFLAVGHPALFPAPSCKWVPQSFVALPENKIAQKSQKKPNHTKIALAHKSFCLFANQGKLAVSKQHFANPEISPGADPGFWSGGAQQSFDPTWGQFPQNMGLSLKIAKKTMILKKS